MYDGRIWLSIELIRKAAYKVSWSLQICEAEGVYSYLAGKKLRGSSYLRDVIAKGYIGWESAL